MKTESTPKDTVPDPGYRNQLDIFSFYHFRISNYGSPAAYKISQNVIDYLDTISTFLKSNPVWALRIEGYSDDTGNVAMDNSNSEARAQEISRHFLSKGITKDRIFTSRKGSQGPIGDNRNDTGISLNRRVVVRLVQIK